MPQGFLGTRADVLIDTVLLLNLVAPAWAYGAARLARRGHVRAHMILQLVLWGVLFCAVIALELHIRSSGGSGSLVGESPYAGTPLLRAVFLLHIGPAVATYLLWSGLALLTLRRRDGLRLGAFARHHQRMGRWVIVGLIWTAASAVAVYGLGFAG